MVEPKNFQRPIDPALMTPEQARELSDALADVLCWFRGFDAAKPDAELPPGLETLREFNFRLKRRF